MGTNGNTVSVAYNTKENFAEKFFPWFLPSPTDWSFFWLLLDTLPHWALMLEQARRSWFAPSFFLIPEFSSNFEKNSSYQAKIGFCAGRFAV